MKVIVLGMHRSGTSLASGLLSQAGVYFGDEHDFIKANEENPKGFWERQDIRRLNDDLLHQMGCDWSEISNLYKEKIPEKFVMKFNSEANMIINDLQQNSDSGIIGLKEPRLCLLMPFWQKLLDKSDFFLLVYRDPEEIAISLQNRNSIPVEVSNYLTEQYLAFAFSAIRKKPHYIVSYRDLVKQPVQATKNIVAAINATGQNLLVPRAEKLVEYSAPELYRSKSMDPAFSVSDRLQWFYKHLERGSIPKIDAMDIPVPEKVLSYQHSKRFEEFTRARWRIDQLEKQILSEKQKSIISQSQQKVEELNLHRQALEIQRSHKQSNQWRSLLKDTLKDTTHNLKTTIHELKIIHQETETLLESSLNLTDRLNLLHTSYSWRLLKPLLALMLRPKSFGIGPTVLDDIDQAIEQTELWKPTHKPLLQDDLETSLKKDKALLESTIVSPTKTDISISSKNLYSRLFESSEYEVKAGLIVTEDSDSTSAGDYFTAKELATALTDKFGWKCSYLPERNSSNDWHDVSDLDVLFVLLDKYDISKLHGQTKAIIKIAWVRNWVDQWTIRPWFQHFDLVLSTSEIAREFIQNQTGKFAHILKIATNTDRFCTSTQISPGLQSDYCFTGSFWGAPRHIESLDPSKLPYTFALYGAGWENHKQFEDNLKGSLPYEMLPAVYASTSILIDDANHATKPWASVNSRVFDALATGTLVITNGVTGAKEAFDDLLPTYSSNHELRSQLRYYLEHPDVRHELATKLQKIVLENHSYKKRAEQFKEILKLEQKARARIAIKLPVSQASEAMYFGEFTFGKNLATALRELGYAVRLDFVPEWYSKPAIQDEVELIIRGESCYQPDKSLLSLLWITSHPGEVQIEELERYEHVFVASDIYAKRLQKTTKTPVTALLQCTSPETFLVQQNQPKSNTIVYFNHLAMKNKPILEDAIESGLSPLVVSRDRQSVIDESLVAGKYIENAALSEFYSTSGAVLCEHSQDMAEHGFISNQLFDTVACGAIPVSRDVPGISEIFGDLVYVYSNEPSQLKTQVNRALSEHTTSQQRRLKLAREISGVHNFYARAKVIDSLISERLLLEKRQSD